MLSRRLLAVQAAGALALIVSALLAAPAAGASGTGCDQEFAGETCTVVADPPGKPGDDASDPGDAGESTRTCEYAGVEIDCDSDAGTWDSSRHCWVQLVTPQPEPGSSSVWEGHTDGAIYQCTPPNPRGVAGAFPGGTMYFWAADPPPRVVPGDLARQAVDSMNLTGATVGATPLDPDAPSVVGIQTWLWIDGADEHTWGPNTATASAGGVTVAATAQATKTVWKLGDGTTVTCRNEGTEWQRSLRNAEEDSPTCGHTYLRESGSQPGHAYTITATTYWEVDWSGGGQSGTITFSLTGPPRRMDVVELQALRTS